MAVAAIANEVLNEGISKQLIIGREKIPCVEWKRI
jgi:hypothetical protein